MIAYGLLLWAVLSIVLACFFTWQKKYDELQVALLDVESAEHEVKQKDQEIADKSSQLISARSELDTERLKNTPNLVAELGRPILWGESPLGVSLILTMTIRNEPPCCASSAYWYLLKFEKNDIKVSYTFQKLNEDFPISGELDNASWSDVISAGDSLPEKTSDPIPAGGYKAGWLVAVLTHFKKISELDGGIITVEFRDMVGKVSSAWFTVDVKSIRMDKSLPTIAGIKGAA